MNNEEIQKTPTDKTPDVVELEAVEIETPRPHPNDVFENTNERKSPHQENRTPPFIFTTSQNGCNNCCLGLLILFILFVLAIF